MRRSPRTTTRDRLSPDGQAGHLGVRQPQRRHGGARWRADPPALRLDLQVDLRRGPLRLQGRGDPTRRRSLLLGRKTYEGFSAAWPERDGDPFADKINSMPKYVVSSTLDRSRLGEHDRARGRPDRGGAEAAADSADGTDPRSTAAPSSPTRSPRPASSTSAGRWSTRSWSPTACGCSRTLPTMTEAPARGRQDLRLRRGAADLRSPLSGPSISGR